MGPSTTIAYNHTNLKDLLGSDANNNSYLNARRIHAPMPQKFADNQFNKGSYVPSSLGRPGIAQPTKNGNINQNRA